MLRGTKTWTLNTRRWLMKVTTGSVRAVDKSERTRLGARQKQGWLLDYLVGWYSAPNETWPDSQARRLLPRPLPPLHLHPLLIHIIDPISTRRCHQEETHSSRGDPFVTRCGQETFSSHNVNKRRIPQSSVEESRVRASSCADHGYTVHISSSNPIGFDEESSRAAPTEQLPSRVGRDAI